MTLPPVEKPFYWKKLGQGLLLSVFSMVFILILIEIGVRQFVPNASPWIDPQIFGKNSPTLKWELKPNQRSFTIDAPVVTNSLGFRDNEFTVKKPPGTFRILFLGDSITFGVGVEFEAIFVQNLEWMLNEQFSHPNYEVINMGVAGYNTRQELIALKEKGIQLEPDLVLMGFYWNDLLGNDRPLPWEPGFVPDPPVVDESGHVEWTEKHLIPKRLRDMLRKWRTLFITVQRVKALKEKIAPSQHPYDVYYRALLNHDEDYLKSSWKSTEKRLQEMVEIGRQYAFPVAIVIFPDGNQMQDQYRDISYQSGVNRIAENLGVFSLDLLPPFKQSYDASVPPFLDYDSAHPNEAGHDIAAQEIFRFLTAHRLIPSS